MAVYPFVLAFTPGRQQIFLRELCAYDELSITDVGTAGAVNLLDRLLVTPSEQTGSSPQAAQFTTADRDRLLAAVYRLTYGSRIESTVTCRFCEARFDVDFSLDDLLTFSQPATDGHLAEPADDGTFRIADDCRFRLPNGADEFAVAGLPSQQAEQVLLQRCLLKGDPATTGDRVQQAMQAVAPLLEMDMAATCPECGQGQPVHFTMQSFLLTRLKNEQHQVVSDMHRLATTYRWAHSEIAGLPRRLRRTYVGFINSDSADRWLS